MADRQQINAGRLSTPNAHLSPITFHLSPFTFHCPIATHHHCAFANSWLACVLGRRVLDLGSAERFCHRAVRCSHCRFHLSPARCATWLVTPLTNQQFRNCVNTVSARPLHPPGG